MSPFPYSPPTTNAAFLRPGTTITHSARSHNSCGTSLSGTAWMSASTSPPPGSAFPPWSTRRRQMPPRPTERASSLPLLSSLLASDHPPSAHCVGTRQEQNCYHTAGEELVEGAAYGFLSLRVRSRYS